MHSKSSTVLEFSFWWCCSVRSWMVLVLVQYVMCFGCDSCFVDGLYIVHVVRWKFIFWILFFSSLISYLWSLPTGSWPKMVFLQLVSRWKILVLCRGVDSLDREMSSERKSIRRTCFLFLLSTLLLLPSTPFYSLLPKVGKQRLQVQKRVVHHHCRKVGNGSKKKLGT